MLADSFKIGDGEASGETYAPRDDFLPKFKQTNLRAITAGRKVPPTRLFLFQTSKPLH